MHEAPPASLVDLLSGLELADASLLQGLERRARRLARGLPLFDSVWIDALVQAGALTLFQAAEIHAGRGGQLAIGPFVVFDRLRTLGSITTYRAFERGTRCLVRLTVADVAPDAPGLAERLRDLLARSKRLDSPHLLPVNFAQIVGNRAVIACDWAAVPTAEEWLIRHGRFAPTAVLQIARQMLIALRDLDTAGLHHGDLTPREILVSDTGQVTLPAPGARAALRPVEGFAFADLSPDAYAAISPERITAGVGVNRAADIFGCGVLWWHLLMGRSPFPLANSVAAQRAIVKHRVPGLKTIVPDLPTPLATAIEACTDPDPLRRPSLDDLEASIKTLAGSRKSVAMPANVAAISARLSGFRSQPPTGSRRVQLTLTLLLFAVGATFAWGFLDRENKHQTGMTSDSSTPAPSASTSAPLTNAAVATTVRDRAVAPATYVAKAIVANPPVTDDLVLPHDRPLHLNSIAPRAKQVVRGQPGTRPQVWISRPGLSIVADGVRFENIDFVWNDRVGSPTDGATPNSNDAPTMFTLLAQGARFDQCSFQSAPGSQSSAEIIRAVEPRDHRSLLPSTAARFTDCAIVGAMGVVDLQRPGSLTAEFSNTLFVRCNSVIRFARRLQADEPLRALFDRCTFRDGDYLVACLTDESLDSGQISVSASNCAFSPGQSGALLRLPPGELTERVKWTGQGTVIAAATRILTLGSRNALSHSTTAIQDDQIAPADWFAANLISPEIRTRFLPAVR